MSAPTVLGEDDDLAARPSRLEELGRHLWRSRDGRTLHSAACPCWRGGPLGQSCRLCKRDHDLYGVCRWARWLHRG